MKSGNLPDTIAQRREAILRERADIAVEIDRLHSRDEHLVREDERLRASETLVLEPYAVSAQWLMAKLPLSSSAFWRLVRNHAKGFPQPFYGLTSDPMWNWAAVKQWLEEREHDPTRMAGMAASRK